MTYTYTDETLNKIKININIIYFQICGIYTAETKI